MIEESAGTSLYNDKKNESLRTIQKKQDKVVEIDNVLKNDIGPKMEKLKNERE